MHIGFALMGRGERMSRLIDADALNAAMYHEAFETDTDMQKWDSGCWIRYQMFERAVKAAPTVEAEPVRHGHWIDKPTGRYGNWQSYCSACGKHSQIGGLESNRHKPRCPWCGAHMDEVSE